MRILFIGRVGAVITASALALSLGVGPVAAQSTATAPSAPTAPSSLSASTAGIADYPVGPARFDSGVITSAAHTRFIGTLVGGRGATATVTINGRTRGTVQVLTSPTQPTLIGIDVPRTWGSGRVQVDIAGYLSNTFYARKRVKTMRGDDYALKINRPDNTKRMTFQARQLKVINPSSGKYVSAKRVKLQQRKKGTWKTLKTIKLNSKGNGTYRTKISKKYRYRLYTARTATQERYVTLGTGKI